MFRKIGPRWARRGRGKHSLVQNEIDGWRNLDGILLLDTVRVRGVNTVMRIIAMQTLYLMPTHTCIHTCTAPGATMGEGGSVAIGTVGDVT